MTKKKQAFIEEYDRPIPQNIERLRKCLAGKSEVFGTQHRTSEAFVLLFLQYFGNFPLTTIDSLNKSNWTHHVYFSIRSTANTLFLSCIFETMGRLDAVVETIEEHPGVVLVAEWESESSSIFGFGNELEKLWGAVNQHKYADAFLLTYCPVDELLGLTEDIVEYWQH